MNDPIFQGRSNRPIYLIAIVWNLSCFTIGIGMVFLALSTSGLAGATASPTSGGILLKYRKTIRLDEIRSFKTIDNVQIVYRQVNLYR